MNSCPIFYVLALIVCVGGWVALFYYCFSAPKGYKGLCPEDVVGKIKRAPKKPKPPPSELDKLLIKPEGVESPVHEICVAILENLDNKRFRFSMGIDNKKYTQVSSILYTPVLIYDTSKKVSIAFTKVWGAGYTPDEVEGLSVEGVKLDLSAEERAYTRAVLTYVQQHLKTRKDKLAKLKEQRHRRSITKLYSEVIPNDQTN